jgi:peroxiredoxin
MKKPASFSFIATVITLVILSTSIKVMAQNTRSAEDAHGLSVGVKAPDFQAIDADSVTFILAEAIKKGPVVLIFYRGQWCSICNRHLAAVQDSLKLITDRGASVVAVSPQKPAYLEKMADKTGATFRLLYDKGFAISDAYDVTFTPESWQLIRYNTGLNADLKESQSDDSQRLPIPATYLINSDGMIVWRHFDPNYKNRSTVKDILDHLPE